MTHSIKWPLDIITEADVCSPYIRRHERTERTLIEDLRRGTRLENRAASKLEECRETLLAAKDKLEWYFRDSGQFYAGGMEYGALIQKIEKALKD